MGWPLPASALGRKAGVFTKVKSLVGGSGVCGQSKVMAPYTFDLGPSKDSTALLCPLCKMGLTVKVPVPKAMVKKKEKHN